MTDIQKIAIVLYDESLSAAKLLVQFRMIAFNLKLQVAYLEDKSLSDIIDSFDTNILTLQGAAKQIAHLTRSIYTDPQPATVAQLAQLAEGGAQFLEGMSLVCMNLQLMCAKKSHPSAAAIQAITPQLIKSIEHFRASIQIEIDGAAQIENCLGGQKCRK